MTHPYLVHRPLSDEAAAQVTELIHTVLDEIEAAYGDQVHRHHSKELDAAIEAALYLDPKQLPLFAHCDLDPF